MGAVPGDGRGHGGRRGARADHDHLLVLVVQAFRPGLRMDDLALEPVHARPFGGVALLVAVIALAHPQEAGGEARRLAGVLAHRLDGPQIVLARPTGRGDLVAVADVGREMVLVDHLAHIAQDFLGAGDRRADPGLEAIAEGVEVAVGADPRIGVGAPGAAKTVQGVQHHETLVRALLGQVIGAAHAGYARPDDQHVEVLALGRGRLGGDRHLVHQFNPFSWSAGLWPERALFLRANLSQTVAGAPDRDQDK